MPITLEATEVPQPMTFSGTTPVIGDVAPGTGPLTSETMESGNNAPFTTVMFNKNGLRHDLTSRYGAGFYFLATGGALTAGSGLSLNVAFLHAVVDGIVEIDAQSIALTDDTRNFIWAKRDGTLEARTDLTQPSQAAAYIGSALAASGSISSVDESGVVYSSMGEPWRETADAGVPGDSPAAALRGLTTKTAGGVYLWGGDDYQLLTPAGGSSVLGVGAGGTGDDLSATGGTAQVVMQEGVGDPFTVRALTSGDLPIIAASKVTSYTILASDNGSTFDNQGGATVFTLPTAQAGLRFTFISRSSGGVTITAASGEIIHIASLTSISTGSVKSGTQAYSVISLVCYGGTPSWAAETLVGEWGIETSSGVFRFDTVRANTYALEPYDPWRPTGVIASSIKRSEITTASYAALSTGVLRLDGVWIRQGAVVSSIAYWTGTTPAGTPTNWWMALYSYHASAPVLLGQSADQTTTAMAQNVKHELALSSPVTITSSGLYYAALMVKATTVPTLRGTSSSLQFFNEQAPVRGGLTGDSGLTSTAPNPAAAIATAEEFISYVELR